MSLVTIVLATQSGPVKLRAAPGPTPERVAECEPRLDRRPLVGHISRPGAGLLIAGVRALSPGIRPKPGQSARFVWLSAADRRSIRDTQDRVSFRWRQWAAGNLSSRKHGGAEHKNYRSPRTADPICTGPRRCNRTSWCDPRGWLPSMSERPDWSLRRRIAARRPDRPLVRSQFDSLLPHGQ